MAKRTRGNLSPELIRAGLRQGDNNVVQMFGGGAAVAGNALVFDAAGNAIDSGLTPGGGVQPYDVTFAYPGAPPNAQTVQLICFSRAIAFAANWAASRGHCGAVPTAAAVFTVQKNGATVGTITIATSGSFTFATIGGAIVSFAAGDTLAILTPPSDATLSSVTITFAGTR